MEIQISTKIDLDVIKKEIIIDSQDDYQQAGDVLKMCKNKIKELEEERKSYTQPLDQSKKLIMAKFNEIIKPLEEYIQKISSAMGNWFLIEEQKRQEEQKRLEQEAIENAGDEVDIEVPIVESLKTQKGNYATSTAVKYYEFEIINENEIPREYLVVNDKKIKEAINKGIKSISGIKIIEKSRIISR